MSINKGYNKIGTLWAVFGFIVVASSCSNKAQVATPDSIQAAYEPAQTPSDFKMMIGRGGGVGGRVHGYSVDGEGIVQKWEGKYPEENIQRTGTLTSDDVHALWRYIEDIDYFSMNQQDMSGIGPFIMVTANGTSHRVSWEIPLGQQPDSTAWQQLYDRCVDMADDVLQGE